MEKSAKEGTLPARHERLQAHLASAICHHEHELLATKRSMKVFVTVFMYGAKPGEEDAIVALHEDWQRRQQSKRKGFLSGELLRDVEDTRTFITILHFDSQIAAQVIVNHLITRWYDRLVSLTEMGLARTDCIVEWQG